MEEVISTGTFTTVPVMPFCLSTPKDVILMKGILGDTIRSSKAVNPIKHSGRFGKSSPLANDSFGTRFDLNAMVQVLQMNLNWWIIGTRVQCSSRTSGLAYFRYVSLLKEVTDFLNQRFPQHVHTQVGPSLANSWNFFNWTS